ncbi:MULTISPECIES: VanW family protein [unclassified Leptolyngbya]|uniref:VanW family protein n=1 Tax=unclassified Leptolyngbya TaxID=2650499 RepID=UPI00168673E1|nr:MULTISPECIES: VanW family protein [unclassified Leptolyngbya]MBD1912947.1 VanW family protein [Leptolyngbya sp. FACHB-8]MBD2154724.1 VanW family protein [Leptolyngbya sp. FACHB-16]
MKKLIPPSWRVNIRIVQRYLAARLTGKWQQLAKHRDTHAHDDFLPQVTLTQPLGSMTGHHLERKKHNLNLAIQKLQNVVILPGQIFSFWHLVGNPTTKAGFVEGRTITGTELATSVGGGLCQLSGMLYFLALKSGLTILERHPHSKDIYTDATRFAPLGSDATVVYGYKDLQIQNSFSFPICFRFFITDQAIQACLCSAQAIAEVQVEFRTQSLESATHVETIRYTPARATAELVSSDLYPKLLVPAHLR